MDEPRHTDVISIAEFTTQSECQRRLPRPHRSDCEYDQRRKRVVVVEA